MTDRVVELRQYRGAIISSTIFVMAATFASTLLGFFREVVNAKYYGTTWQMDTYLVAGMIPTILFGVFNGALVSVLVPTFSEYLASGDEEGAWRLANTVINILLIGVSICAIVGYVAAPLYVPVIAHGFPPYQLEEAERMTRWLMTSIVALSLSGVLGAMLNAYHRFRSAALVGVALNIMTIGCVMLFSRNLGIYALVLGTTLGFMAQFVVQVPAFLSIGRYRFELDLRHPGLARMWSMLAPIIIGSAAGQASLFFDRYFASTLPQGHIAGMNYATKLVFFPQQIFAAAIATVIFPLLSRDFAREDRAGVARSATTGLKLVNFILVPATVGLIILGAPIVQTLFQRGSFDATSAQLTSTFLPFAAIGLVSIGAGLLLTKSCFACREMTWTVGIAIFTVALNIVLSLLWIKSLGARGLLLANSVSQTSQALMLLALLWRVVGKIDGLSIANSLLRILGASLVMGVSLYFVAGRLHPGTSLMSRLACLLLELAVGAIAFVAASALFRVDELSLIMRIAKDRIRRNEIAADENTMSAGSLP